MCKVSIIMPSLNVGRYIEECIESVIKQTLKDIEIICVDAGSTDGTLEILRQYSENDKRIKVIESDKKSYGYQMNLGISHARGEYIGIVETDDLIDSDMFEKMYLLAEDNKVDFVKSSYKEFVECRGGKLINTEPAKKLPERYLGRKIILKEDIKARFIDPVHIWSGLYRKSFLEQKQIRFNETPGASYQDTSFSLLVGILAETCVYIRDTFYSYRVDNENSSVKSDTKIDCVVKEFEFLEKEIRVRNITDINILSEIKKNKISVYIWNYLRLSEQSGEKFLDIICDEMYDYYNDKSFIYSLDDNYIRYLKLLLRKEHIDKENEVAQFDNVYKLIRELNTDNSFIIVGAGNYAGRILLMYRYMKGRGIKGVCDNSKAAVGKRLDRYVVEHVEEMVKKYPDCRFIVANRKCCGEITEQLKRLNIGEDKIISCDNLPDWATMISIYKDNFANKDNE